MGSPSFLIQARLKEKSLDIYDPNLCLKTQRNPELNIQTWLWGHIDNWNINQGINQFSKQHGRFNIFLYDRKNNILNIINDQYGRKPILLFSNHKGLYISHNERLIFKNVKPLICRESVFELLQEGILRGGKTLFRGLTIAPPGSHITYNLNTGQLNMNSIYPPSSITPKNFVDSTDVALFADAIYASVQCLIQRESPKKLFISGGLDTRVILNCLSSEQRKSIEFLTIHSPLVSDDKDTDVIIARMLCKKAGLNHRVLKAPVAGLYFLDEERKDSFGGLYGGEYMGGQLGCAWPTKMESYLCNMTNDFMRSYRSTIYESIDQSWTEPYLMLQACSSPFTEEIFLNTFHSYCPEVFKGYKLYYQMYSQYFNEFIDLPLYSPITHFTPLQSLAINNEDPKSALFNRVQSFSETNRNKNLLFLSKTLPFFIGDISIKNLSGFSSIHLQHLTTWLKNYPSLRALSIEAINAHSLSNRNFFT